jgi:hypothetical protein
MHLAALPVQVVMVYQTLIQVQLSPMQVAVAVVQQQGHPAQVVLAEAVQEFSTLTAQLEQ